MKLPAPEHVEDARGRLWDRAYIERTGLYLMGIALSLHAGAASDFAQSERLSRIAASLEADFPALAELLEGEWTHVPGAHLPERVVYLLCCHDEATLSEALAVPIKYVYAGADRMSELARRLVDGGMGGTLPADSKGRFSEAERGG